MTLTEEILKQLPGDVLADCHADRLLSLRQGTAPVPMVETKPAGFRKG